MHPKHLSIKFILSLGALTLGAHPVHTSAEPQVQKYMGTGSCSSSNCHGSVNALNGSQVLQNEYHTWLKLDKHSKAYAALLNDDSKKIGQHLGIQHPEQEPLCLRCHSTYVPDIDARGAKYQLEDGVSCESCHGAAEKWLPTHSVSGATHEQNLGNHLADIAPLDKRAKVCLSCHFGTDEKTVNHNLYGAGHPRLSFELDTFGVLQPKHWVVDEDYRKRKGEYLPVVSWLVGQTSQAQETLLALESPKRSRNGWYPELSLFDCNSCHHSLTEEQWKSRTYSGPPGELHLNLPSLIVLREAFTALDPKVGGEIKAALAELHTNYKNDGGKKSIPNLRKIMSEKALPAARLAKGDASYCRALLKQLSRFAANTPSLKYEMAEQIGMGMQALLASNPELGNKYKADLDVLFGTLKSAKSFAPEKFTEAARRISANS